MDLVGNTATRCRGNKKSPKDVVIIETENFGETYFWSIWWILRVSLENIFHKVESCTRTDKRRVGKRDKGVEEVQTADKSSDEFGSEGGDKEANDGADDGHPTAEGVNSPLYPSSSVDSP
mgnify:CR=1 FL=1